MTAQISDTFLYNGEQRVLAGINGSGLFDPADHGITVQAISTACWRGYFCTYHIEDGQLRLSSVNLGLKEEAVAAGGIKLFGKAPARYDEEYTTFINGQTERKIGKSWDFRIDGLQASVHFTGGLLLGKDFIREMYVHMGFHPAYKFREVHEVILDQGKVTAVFDRSAQMAQLREHLLVKAGPPKDSPTKAELQAWIERAFSLKYEGFGL